MLNQTTAVLVVAPLLTAWITCAVTAADRNVTQSVPSTTHTYRNILKRIEDPKPLLADHPEFIHPVVEETRYEAPILVDDPDADLEVRAWRFSYNARGIIEMPNRLSGKHTAVIMVHPWGIDDGQGWKTPEPAGVCDFCTPTKNHLAARHTREVISPFLKALRPHVAFTMFSLPGNEDPIRKKLYRSFTSTPTEAQRNEGRVELARTLNEFDYTGQPLPETVELSSETPVIDYFKQFPGLDAGARYNHAGFWDLPIPITRDVETAPEDVVIYDSAGYPPLRDFLKKNGVRHVILTGYATDMCFCRTTAGYENLSKDFNVFLVGDATLATFPANDNPRSATNASISFASLNQLVTQISWVKIASDKR
jgi:nicotinamidase-related amidase